MGHSGTDQEQTGPVLDPFGSVPDRFQNSPAQNRSRSGPVQFGMVPVWSHVNVA